MREYCVGCVCVSLPVGSQNVTNEPQISTWRVRISSKSTPNPSHPNPSTERAVWCRICRARLLAG